MFVFIHNFLTDDNGERLYLNYNKKDGNITALRNTNNNERYLVQLTLEQMLLINNLIDINEWTLALYEELGTFSNLFNLKHKYIKSKTGTDQYFNITKNGRTAIKGNKTNQENLKAEFTKEEIMRLKKLYNLDNFEVVGVI